MNTQTEPKIQGGEFVVQERTLIYCRVSTDEQAESGTSLDNQLEKNLAYAQANNMQVIAVFKEDYTGRTLDRPELNKLREMLRRGQADNLIVYKPNRLDRSEWGLNTLLLMQELKTLGVNLHYSQDNRRVDLTNPMEVFMYGSFAGWQAGEDHRETVKKLYEGRLARARAGYVVPTGKAPYGYHTYKGEDKKWYFEIIEDEGRIVRLIFEWYVVDGLSLLGIATKLNSTGIKARKGGLWQQSMIHKIVANTVYYGTWHFSKRDKCSRPTAASIPVPVPAIIDPELWETAQNRLQENKARSTRNRKPGRYLLAGRITCGCCGYKLAGRTSHRRGKSREYLYSFYCCANAYTPERFKCSGCVLPLFRADIVDQKVWGWLEEITRDHDRLLEGLMGYNEAQKAKLEPIHRDLALTEATLKDKKQELTNAMAGLKFLTDDLSRAIHGSEIDALAAIIKNLEADQAKLLAQLEVSTFKPEHAMGIIAFMAQVAEDIETIKQAEAQGIDLPEFKIAVYAAKRRLLAWLDVQVKLFLLDGKKKAEVKAKVCPDGEVLSIDSPNTSLYVNKD